MALVEINFDGIVGPSHNYAGLSLGNLAATANAGKVAFPRAAALQGVAKMRHNLGLGLVQGIFLPHERPNRAWLAALGTDPRQAPEALRAAACSASAMWAANAATVSPGPDYERRPLPPHRRQPPHHGAPQPRMAGDLGAAAARLCR